MSTNDDIYPGYVPLTPTQKQVGDALVSRRWQEWQQQQWLRTWYNVGRTGALSEKDALDALARLAGLEAKDRATAAAARARMGTGK